MSKIAERIQNIRAQIEQTCHQANRDPDTVTLIAVSKTFPADAIAEAFSQGQAVFGESYVQEAVQKVDALRHLDITWHFIGPLQSNKTRPVAERFHWVHSVDREKIAQRLNDQRPATLAPLNVCIQVNVSNDPAKGGVLLNQVKSMAETIDQLPNLQLRGLMAVPALDLEESLQRRQFESLRAAVDELAKQYPSVDTLSLGMSADWPLAVASGSTMIRVGSSIFGPRQYPTGDRA